MDYKKVKNLEFLLFFLFSCSNGREELNDFEIKISPSHRCLQAYERVELSVEDFTDSLTSPFRVEWKAEGNFSNFYPLPSSTTAYLISGPEEGEIYTIRVKILTDEKDYSSQITLWTLTSKQDSIYLSNYNHSGLYTGSATSPFVDLARALEALETRKILFMSEGKYYLQNTLKIQGISIKGGLDECFEEKTDGYSVIYLSGLTGIHISSGKTEMNGVSLELNWGGNEDGRVLLIENGEVFIERSRIIGPLSSKNSRGIEVMDGNLYIYNSHITGAIISTGTSYGIDLKGFKTAQIENSFIEACSESCDIGFGISITSSGDFLLKNSKVSAGYSTSTGFGIYLAGSSAGSVRIYHSLVRGSSSKTRRSTGIGNYLVDVLDIANSIIHSGNGDEIIGLWNMISTARPKRIICTDFWTARGGEQCDAVQDPLRYLILTGSLMENQVPVYCSGDGYFSINPEFLPDEIHLEEGSSLKDLCEPLHEVQRDIDGEERPCGKKSEPGPDEICP